MSSVTPSPPADAGTAPGFESLTLHHTLGSIGHNGSAREPPKNETNREAQQYPRTDGGEIGPDDEPGLTGRLRDDHFVAAGHREAGSRHGNHGHRHQEAH